MVSLGDLCCEVVSVWNFRTKITSADFRDDFGKKLEGKFNSDLYQLYDKNDTVLFISLYKFTLYKLFGRGSTVQLWGWEMNFGRNQSEDEKIVVWNLHRQNLGNHKLPKVTYRIMDFSESWNSLWRCREVSLQ